MGTSFSQVTNLLSFDVNPSVPPSTKIGFGGGCHWCTEGIFASVLGVKVINQGWIAAQGEQHGYSEAIELSFDASVIDLATLIKIHLYTHASTSSHSMRDKYRSGVYVYDDAQFALVQKILKDLAAEFDQPIITQTYRFADFKINKPELLDYFYTGPHRPFCKTYIHPKLQKLMAKFSNHMDLHKLSQAGIALQK